MADGHNSIVAATVAANTQGNVRITLLPNEFGPLRLMRTPCHAGAGIKSLKCRKIIFGGRVSPGARCRVRGKTCRAFTVD
jgi:hypothetical protein